MRRVDDGRGALYPIKETSVELGFVGRTQTNLKKKNTPRSRISLIAVWPDVLALHLDENLGLFGIHTGCQVGGDGVDHTRLQLLRVLGHCDGVQIDNEEEVLVLVLPCQHHQFITPSKAIRVEHGIINGRTWGENGAGVEARGTGKLLQRTLSVTQNRYIALIRHRSGGLRCARRGHRT